MRILVTGAAGQVGREILGATATDPSIAVFGFGRHELDITDAEAVAEAFSRVQPDVLVNCAAYTAVDRAEAEIEQAFAANADGARALARRCAWDGVPLLHVSTDYVFSGDGDRPWREDDPTSPLGVYGRSKLRGEEAVREALHEHVILRTSWVFGRSGGNFVKTMLRAARSQAELRVVDDQRGCPTPARAVADALLDVAARLAAGDRGIYGVYHFAGQPTTTWRWFAEAIVGRAMALGLLGQPPTVTPIATADYPTAARRPANSELDCDRWRATFETPLPDWRRSVDDALLAETADRVAAV